MRLPAYLFLRASRFHLLRSRVAPLTCAIIANLDGPAEAGMIIESEKGRITHPIARARLAQVALRINREDLAEEILHTLDHPSPTVQEARATLLVQTGRLDAGRALLEGLRHRGVITPGGWRQLIHVRGRTALLRSNWSWARPAVDPPAPIPARILHVLTNSLPYKHAGYTIRSHSVGRCQQAVGLDPHFVTRAGFPQLQGVVSPAPCDMIDGLPYHRIPLSGTKGLADDELVRRTAHGIVDVAKQLAPACLHPATYHFNAQAALAARDVLDIPLIYEVRGFLEDTWLSAQTDGDAVERDYYQWSREAETRSMQASDHVVTLSETMRQEIVRRGIPESKITIIPNAVDDTKFSPGASNPTLRTKYGIPPDSFVVGYVGSFVAYEGLSTLLEAVAKLRTIRQDVHALCVGDGPDFGKLLHTAQKLHIGQATTFSGRIAHDGIVDLYRLLDAFVVPRRNLRVCQLVTPMKPIEAMACGIPLVTSTLPPLTELSSGGAAGPSFVPEDPDHLAATLDGLLNDPAARRQYARAGRRLAQKHYTWSRNASRYRELYETLGVTEPRARHWSVDD